MAAQDPGGKALHDLKRVTTVPEGRAASPMRRFGLALGGPMPRTLQMRHVRAMCGKALVAERVADNASVFEQQFSQGTRAQTLQRSPGAFQCLRAGYASGPDRWGLIDPQQHFTHMSAPRANGTLFLGPQALVSLAKHLNAHGAKLTQAGCERARCRQPSAGLRRYGRALASTLSCWGSLQVQTVLVRQTM